MMQKKIENITFLGIVLFFFCYFLQCLDLAFLDVHNEVTVLFGAALCGVYIIRQRKIRIDLESCLLAITLLMYFIMDLGMYTAIKASYFYVAMLIYVLANYVACEIKEQEQAEEKFILLLLVMALGVTVHGLANSHMFFKGEFWGGTNRVWRDFWSRDIIYGTMQVAYFLPAFAMVFPALICFKKRKILSTFFCVATVVFLVVAVKSQTRMPILILPIVFVLQFAVYAFLEKNKVRSFFTPKRLLLLVGTIVTLACICGIFLYTTSTGKAFLGAMSRDGGIFNNIRFKIQRSALEQLFLYPMGGNKMDHLGYGHTHNAWLDVADVAGLVPFFSFVIYTILTLYELVKCVKTKAKSTEVKLLFVGFFVIYFIFFTIEPSLDWSVHFMTPWLFLHGLVHGYVKEEKRKI